MITVIPIFPIEIDTRVSNPFVLSGWVQPTSMILFLIGITSITHIVAMTASIRAYQSTESSFVAPLEYTYLVFALIIDHMVWQTLPNAQGIIGVTLVIGAGVMIAIREGIERK